MRGDKDVPQSYTMSVASNSTSPVSTSTSTVVHAAHHTKYLCHASHREPTTRTAKTSPHLHAYACQHKHTRVRWGGMCVCNNGIKRRRMGRHVTRVPGHAHAQVGGGGGAGGVEPPRGTQINQRVRRHANHLVPRRLQPQGGPYNSTVAQEAAVSVQGVTATCAARRGR